LLSTAATGASSTLGSWVIFPDALSRPPTVTDGKGQTSTYSYDGLDRVKALAYPNGPSFGFGYVRRGSRMARAGVVAVLLAAAGGAGSLPQTSQARESFGAGSYLPAAPVALMGGGVGWGVYRRDGGFELRTGRAGVARALRVRVNRERQHYFRLSGWLAWAFVPKFP